MQWSISDTWIHPRLGAWLASLLGERELAVTFGAPGPDGGPPQPGRARRGINLHLLSVAPHERPTTWAERRTEARLVLRYLATSWAEQGDAAVSLLCELAFQVLGHGAGGPDGQSEIAVEPAAPPLELLAAVGLGPRPALVLALPLVYVERAAPAPRVRSSVVQATPSGALWGVLVGPDDVPVAAAEVGLPDLGRATVTDRAGQFRFSSVPAELAGQTIRIRARGIERSFQLAGSDAASPVTLRLTFAEEG